MTPPLTTTPRETLRRVFGYQEFRLNQEDIIEHVIGGGDAFVLMPTGGGKSLCYQIPALHRAGVGVVVSPLISLMKDQVDALRGAGVAAAQLNSSLEAGEGGRVLRALRAEALDLLYVTPERLLSAGFLELLDDVTVALFAIDEAHCVSQWGHDFRPEYVELGRLRGHFPDVPLVGLTATADDQTRSDVRERLGLAGAPLYVAGFDRPNIRYLVAEKNKPQVQLAGFLEKWPGEAGIVYCLSRKRVEEVAGRLRSAGIDAAAYHAGLPAQERTRVQEAFQRDELRVVVATVAFGMGIDKSNVRFVVHHDMPKSLESYYQETGRAGRDGLPAEALLLFGLQDAVVARSLIESGENPEQIRVDLHKLNAMVGFAESLGCRRRALLGYFGETLRHDCGNCDVCLDPPEFYDATEEAQKALSCVYRVGQRFGLMHVIDVLRGADSERIRSLGHQRLSTYGLGADRSKDHWAGVFRQLIHRGYLYQDIARYSVLTLTAEAWPLLRGEVSLTLARPRVRALPKVSRKKEGSRSIPAVAGGLDRELFDRLRSLRRKLAEEQGVPAYVVFSDATLEEMTMRRPRTEAELLAVNGVGEKKLERYGSAFLEALRAEDQVTRPLAETGGREGLAFGLDEGRGSLWSEAAASELRERER